MLREQYHFSRERGVDNFGVQSMWLITKASILEAVDSFKVKGLVDSQPHLTSAMRGDVRDLYTK